MNLAHWDARYADAALPYGEGPNDFLVAHAAAIPPGPVLCLAEGYGRNALWLAAQGRDVTAVDQSGVALARGRALAAARGVAVTFVQGDLAGYVLGEGRWAGIVSIFGHADPVTRAAVHARVARALVPGGVFLLEAYAPGQLGRDTGGPRELPYLMAATDLARELAGLACEILREVERPVLEGPKHTGAGVVTQVLARRP